MNDPEWLSPESKNINNGRMSNLTWSFGPGLVVLSSCLCFYKKNIGQILTPLEQIFFNYNFGGDRGGAGGYSIHWKQRRGTFKQYFQSVLTVLTPNERNPALTCTMVFSLLEVTEIGYISLGIK